MLKFTAIALAAVLATGCATHAQTGALVGGVVGAAIGGPAGGVAAAHIALGVTGAVVGALIGGAIGAKMDAHDHAMVMKSVETSKSESWTSSSGTAMKSDVKEVTPEKKQVTVTAGEKSETTTVVKKQGKWVKE